MGVYPNRKSRLILNSDKNRDNVGAIIWRIPNDFPNSNHNKIKLLNNANEKEFGYSVRFGIQSE